MLKLHALRINVIVFGYEMDQVEPITKSADHFRDFLQDNKEDRRDFDIEAMQDMEVKLK